MIDHLSLMQGSSFSKNMVLPPGNYGLPGTMQKFLHYRLDSTQRGRRVSIPVRGYFLGIGRPVSETAIREKHAEKINWFAESMND
jgi:hypothetical protein